MRVSGLGFWAWLASVGSLAWLLGASGACLGAGVDHRGVADDIRLHFCLLGAKP